MSGNATNWYDLDPHIAEWYDATETYTDDVELIRHLLEGRGALRILEPFCGTGRILIPIALDGHEIVGLDEAKTMLDQAGAKVAGLAEDVRRRIMLNRADVTADVWPAGFDLVVLGGNCLYELATPEEQEGCIASAAASLKSGGCLYLDNDHMEGELDETWRQPGRHKAVDWTCADGSRLERFGETIWYDAPLRLWRSRQCWRVTSPTGEVAETEFIQQKHPVSVVEQQDWLEKHGFVIQHLYGGRDRSSYAEASDRAILWARRPWQTGVCRTAEVSGSPIRRREGQAT